jgi:glycosyltransferase involved in cell wall biosynthesis
LLLPANGAERRVHNRRRAMKVLLVSPHFPPSRIGGVEFYTKRLADHLQACGDRPEVMCAERIDATGANVSAATDAAFGFPVHRLSFNQALRSSPATAGFRNDAVTQWTLDLIDRRRPDVVHLHSGYLLGGAVLSAARARKVPAIVTLHDFWFICPRITLLHPDGRRCSGPDSPEKCTWCLATEQRRFRLPDAASRGAIGTLAIRLLQHRAAAAAAGWERTIADLQERRDGLRDALMQADVLLAPSQFLRGLIAETGIPAERITISRYGIDAPARKPRVRADPSTLVLGYLGQLAPHKGVGVLIDAVRRLTGAEVRVRIYGDPASHGGYGADLMRRAGGDRRIEFCGPYRHEHVYELLASLDTIVVPSVWYENAPFVIQEAQAAGVPVLASRLGGMRELVSDGVDGLLFEPGDAADLARQLRRLVSEPGLLDRLQPDGSSVRTEDDELRELRGHYLRLARRQ